jgi:hypothetical protein
MYTESFMGDIDGILARMALRQGKTMVITLPENKGKGGTYGMSKAQTAALGDNLLTIARAFNAGEINQAVIFVDEHNRICLRSAEQAANLYQRVTHNCFIAGMCGQTGKPQIKRF